MSDWTEEEYRRFQGGRAHTTEEETMAYMKFDENTAVPANGIDWCHNGACNPIKFQGYCGSCWAFSSVAVLESVIKISRGTLYSLSEQQLLDCQSPTDSCNGGSGVQSYEYWKTNFPEPENVYPYVHQKNACKYNKSKSIGFGTKGNVNVPKNNPDAIKAILQHQPVSACLDSLS